MVGIKKKLKGNSLLECIVAGVILLVCFTVTMEVLTRITLSKSDLSTQVVMELSLRSKIREHLNQDYLPGKYTSHYEWGTLETETRDYHEKLYRLTLTAYPTKECKPMKYEYLIRK